MIGAVIGGLAGGLAAMDPKRSSSVTNSVSDIQLKDINELNKGRSELEAAASGGQLDYFRQLMGLVGQGPGAQDVAAGLGAQRSFADLLAQQATTGGLPSQTQIAQGQQYAQSIFDPQRVAMQQAFQQQDIAQQRLAARLGRGGADPILRAKMAEEQTRQQAQLQAQQGAFAAETSMGLPQRQLQLMEAMANVRGGLASQAFQNRQALLTMGTQLAESERNYRLQTARKTGYSRGTTSDYANASTVLGGAMAGAGTGMRMGSLFGGASTTSAPSAPSSEGSGMMRLFGGF